MKLGKHKKVRIYLDIEISKKQKEWVSWYERGTDDWWEAYYEYPARRRRNKNTDMKLEKTWFNKVLRTLKKMGLFMNVPEAFVSTYGICWKHPGFANDGYRAEVLDRDLPDNILEFNKPII